MTRTSPIHPGLILLALIIALGATPVAIATASGSSPGDRAMRVLQDDDDKPGKGNNEDKREKKDKEDKSNNGKAKGKDKDKVDPLEGYSVAVSCTALADGVETACTFIADGPKGKGKVKVLFVPQANECLAGAESEAGVVGLEPGAAYASRKNQPQIDITLPGRVTVGGTATYWVEADKSLLPAPGPGLVCSTGKPAPEPTTANKAPQPTTEPTVEPTAVPATTGRIAIQVHACAMTADATMASDETDWYGDCAHDGTTYRFQLESVDNGETRVTATTDSEGMARFNELDPGRYRLTLVDLDWCHAESDSVDGDGLVTVEAGGTASVWIFVCGSAA
jgi:hypothetical protein